MAFRNTSTSDSLTLGQAPNYNGEYTLMWWCYVESAAALNQALVTIDDGSTSNQDRFGVSSNGQTLRLTVTDGGASTHTTGSSVDTGVWNHFTLRRESTTLLRVLKNGASVVTNTRDVSSRTASSRVRLLLGNNVWRLAAFKAFDRVLTDAEVAQEMLLTRPSGIQAPWCWLPLHALDVAGGAVDFSGNGRTFTVNGAPDLVAGPPLSWGAAPLLLTPPAASGDLELQPTAVTSTGTVANPTLALDAPLELEPTATTSSGTVANPTVSLATALELEPTAVTSSGTVGNPTIALIKELEPTAVTSAGTVGNPTLALDAALELAPTAVTSSGTIANPTLSLFSGMLPGPGAKLIGMGIGYGVGMKYLLTGGLDSRRLVDYIGVGAVAAMSRGTTGTQSMSRGTNASATMRRTTTTTGG